MMPTGTASLNDIVTDLDLTTANANLNDQYIRARAKKYSGAVSVNDLRGTVSAVMPYMATGAGNNKPPRYLNGVDIYSPLGNNYDWDCKMVNDGNASTGIEYYIQHQSQGGGDATIQSVHTGYFPVSNYGNVKMEGIIDPDYGGLNYFMKLEIFGWQNDYFVGSPFEMYTLDNIRTTTDLAPRSQFVEVRSDFPWVTAIVYAVIKSAAPDLEYQTGKMTGFRLGY